MYRQIYRDKILYYLATQRFNSQKTLQQNPNSQIRRPYPGGTPHFCQKGLLLYPSITNTRE